MRSRQLSLKAPMLRDRTFADPPSDIDTAAKDLDLALGAATGVGTVTPFAATARQLMTARQAHGEGDLDIWSVIRSFEAHGGSRMVTADEPGTVDTLGATTTTTTTTTTPTTAAARLPGTDLDVSPLVLGGNMLGSRLDQDASFALLDAYAEAGGTMVDTAAVYSDWLPRRRGRLQREHHRPLAAGPSVEPMLVATKGGHPQPADPSRPRLDAAALRADVEQSLTRLGIDTLPLWFTHRDDPAVPVAAIIETIEGLRADGLRAVVRRVQLAAPARGGGRRPARPGSGSRVRRHAVRLRRGQAATRPAGGRPRGGRRAHASQHTVRPPSPCSPTRPRPRGGSRTHPVRGRRTTRHRTGGFARSSVRSRTRPCRSRARWRWPPCCTSTCPLRLVVGCSSTDRLHDALGATTLRLTGGQLDRIRHALVAVQGEPEPPSTR